MSAVADTRMQHAMLAAHEYLQRMLALGPKGYAGTVQQFDAKHYAVSVISPQGPNSRHVIRAVQIHQDASTTRMRSEIDLVIGLVTADTTRVDRPKGHQSIMCAVVEHVRETLQLLGHNADVSAVVRPRVLDVLAVISPSRSVRLVLPWDELGVAQWRELITARLVDRPTL